MGAGEREKREKEKKEKEKEKKKKEKEKKEILGGRGENLTSDAGSIPAASIGLVLESEFQNSLRARILPA